MDELRELLRYAGRIAARVLVGFSLLVMLFLGVGPRIWGYRTLTVLTGSMAPKMPAGSVVVVAPQPRDQIKVRQVITYTAPIEDKRVVTHRVIELKRNGGDIVVRTKGDASDSPDPWLARIESPEVWRVRWVVPRLGFMINALRVGALNRILVLALPIWFAISTLRQVWRAGGRRVTAPGAHG